MVETEWQVDEHDEAYHTYHGRLRCRERHVAKIVKESRFETARLLSAFGIQIRPDLTIGYQNEQPCLLYQLVTGCYVLGFVPLEAESSRAVTNLDSFTIFRTCGLRLRFGGDVRPFLDKVGT